MATYEDPNDPYLTCPFDSTHLEMKSRMQYHLFRCQRSPQRRTDKLVCPYNSMHIVPSSELMHHVSNDCPDRSLQETSEPIKPVVFSNPPVLPPCEEDWDTDTAKYEKPVPQDKVVLRNLVGATKRQRKKFRQDERDRAEKILKGRTPEPGRPSMPFLCQTPQNDFASTSRHDNDEEKENYRCFQSSKQALNGNLKK